MRASKDTRVEFEREHALTGDVGGGPDDGGDLRIHVHGVALVDQELLVALLDLGPDPFCKDISEQGGADVSDVLLQHLRDLLWIVRQIVVDGVVFADLVGDVLDGEAIILRYRHAPGLAAVELLLLAAHDVLQVVDRDLF